MTVTEITKSATSPGQTDQPASPLARTHKWGEGDPQSCFRTDTRYRNRQVYQQVTACKQLDCDWCGPRKREQAYNEAMTRYAAEEEVWAICVRKADVDRLRKRAGRADQPVESVPIADDWNIIISPYHFEGAVKPTDEALRRLFLVLRVSRRKHTRNGRWREVTVPKKDNGVTLSRGFVSQTALENVAKRLKAFVLDLDGVVSFRDTEDRGPDWMREALVEEEKRLRLEKRRLIGRAA